MGKYRTSDATVSAINAISVTPSDGTYIPTTRALWVGGGGNVAVEMVEGGVVTFTSVTSGSLLPVQVIRVLSTGTTATNILAMY